MNISLKNKLTLIVTKPINLMSNLWDQWMQKFVFSKHVYTTFTRSATLEDTSWVRLTLQAGTCQIFSLAENPIVRSRKFSFWFNIFLVANKFCVQNFFWSTPILGRKKIRVKKFWGPQKIGPNKYIKNVGTKKIESEKKSGANLTKL